MKRPVNIVLSEQAKGSQDIMPSETLKLALGVSDSKLITEKINDISKLLWFHENASDETKNTRILRALELYESLEPADGAEGMLGLQMVGTHDAALQCLKRAALPNQTFAGRDMALKHASKLMALYTQQLAALNKHRGKGQQKVTVEHVNVAAGGQAIVGNIETGQRKKPQITTKADVSDAIEHTPDVPLPDVSKKSAGARKKR